MFRNIQKLRSWELKLPPSRLWFWFNPYSICSVKLRKYTWHQADTQVISLFISNLSLNIYFCFSGLGGWLRLTLDTTNNHKFLQNSRPVHRHPDIFESATFSFWIHNISSSTRSKNIRNRCQIDPSPKWRPKIQIS